MSRPGLWQIGGGAQKAVREQSTASALSARLAWGLAAVHNRAMDSDSKLDETIDHLVELEAEREVSAIAATGGDDLAYARAALREWVDSVVGIVAAAGSGRVTLIHANGKRSGIASAELAQMVTPPVKWD
jgi:hypothetical protein